MSRTFRRKGYESANRYWKEGTKVAGFYTEYDVEHTSYVEDGTPKYGYLCKYRKPTRHEHNKQYWGIHGDGRYRDYGRDYYFLNNLQKRHRMAVKTELFRYLKNTEHEVIIQYKKDKA